MPLLNNIEILTSQDYLAWEKDQPSDVKHEYVKGDIYAMAGAKDAHVTVAGNLFSLLRNHVRGSSCRVYMADMKVRVETANAFFYPDVMITCDERDRQYDYYKKHPSLIIEVLSESTSAYDRGRKFAMYRQLTELKEYVIIDPDMMSVDCFRHDATDHWVLHPFVKEDQVELATIDFSTKMEAIYEDVIFPEKPTNR